jgi:hypothetical protein
MLTGTPYLMTNEATAALLAEVNAALSPAITGRRFAVCTARSSQSSTGTVSTFSTSTPHFAQSVRRGGGGGQNVRGTGACTVTTCAAQGKTCGVISDGCGSTLPCGTCGATLGNVCQ